MQQSLIKKATLFLFCFILAFPFIQGQNQSSSEVVYLKNGSIVKGNIVEWIPNESISMQTSDGNLFVFKITEIERVKRELSKVDATPQKEKVQKTPNLYESNIALGFGSSSGKYGLDVLCFNLVYGKNLDKHHFIGAGTGVRYFDAIEMTMIPIIVDWRYKINQNDISPYVRLSAGYSLNVSNGIENSGFLVDPRIGIDFKLNQSFLSIDMGYQTQQMAFFTIENPNIPWELSKIYRFSESLKFSLSLSF
jgi:hypothetical protein